MLEQNTNFTEYQDDHTVDHMTAKPQRLLRLTPKESSLLRLFLNNPNKLLTHDEIVEHLWPSRTRSSAALRTTIKRLRKKIDIADQPSLIDNSHGLGYRFDPVNWFMSGQQSQEYN